MENNKLVILGTNEYQNPLILRAKELGYETHVFGWKTGEIGEKTADHYYDIDIMDYDKLWEQVSKIKPCGVVTIASEIAIHPMNFLLRKLGIPCNSIETEKIATNKYLMRCAMRDAGIEGPNFMLIDGEIDKKELSKLNYPLIVKPVDMSSSRGVAKINCEKELLDSVKYAMSWSQTKQCILEEFIEGKEYSGESISFNGKYKLLAVTEKTTTGAPHFVEIGHRQPADISHGVFLRIQKTLYKAFASLGIMYGAIHPEFRITSEGKIYFMEIGARMGGDCIGSDLVPISTGYDYLGMTISCGCGKKPSFKRISKPMKAEIKYIISEKDYQDYLKIQKESPDIIFRQSSIKAIDGKPILKSADRAGYYIIARKP